MTDLAIPQLPEDADTLSAALAYTASGWYVLPVKRGTKKPGSVVGDRWQTKSSRDAKQIAAWFAGTNHDIALHCGRSGGSCLTLTLLTSFPASCAITWKRRRFSPHGPTFPAVAIMYSPSRQDA